MKKGTKTVILVITIITSIGIAMAYYYNRIKKTEDPRIVQTKAKYESYNKLLAVNDYDGVFRTLDTIEQIFLSYNDYKSSFEMGVLQNNKAAAWLTLALNAEDDSIKYIYLENARQFTTKGIEIFENWQKEFEGLERNDIIMKISEFYNPDDTLFRNLKLVNIINKRTEDIQIAQQESYRRLSIAYTNLGTICSQSRDYEHARKYNRKALDLWPDNKTAKNNISILFSKSAEE